MGLLLLMYQGAGGRILKITHTGPWVSFVGICIYIYIYSILSAYILVICEDVGCVWLWKWNAGKLSDGDESDEF